MGLSNSTQPSQQQLLLQAVVSGDSDLALSALKLGASVNSSLVIFQGTWKRLNKKLLHLAVELGNVEVAKILIQHGATVNSTTIGTTTSLIDPNAKYSKSANDDEIRDVTPLHIAASKGNVQMVKLLLKYSANANAATLWNADRDSASMPPTRGFTALHISALKGYLDIVHLLLRADVFVNASVETSGWTALHYACYQGHVEIVRLLLHHGANASAMTRAGKWPADLTANVEILGLLSKYMKKSGDGSERISPNSSMHLKSNNKLIRSASATAAATAVAVEPRLLESRYNQAIFGPMIDTMSRFAKENNFFALFGVRWHSDRPPSKADLIKARRSLESSSLSKRHDSGSGSPNLLAINHDSLDEAESSVKRMEERLQYMEIVWDNLFKYDDLLSAYIKLERIRSELYPRLFGRTISWLEQLAGRIEEIETLFVKYSHIEFLAFLRKEVEFARDVVAKAVKNCE